MENYFSPSHFIHAHINSNNPHAKNQHSHTFFNCRVQPISINDWLQMCKI